MLTKGFSLTIITMEMDRLLRTMNEYKKAALVIGELGEYSHDMGQLLKYMARKKAQHESLIRPSHISEAQAYAAYYWDFRKRLSLISAKRFCDLISNGRAELEGSGVQSSSIMKFHSNFNRFSAQKENENLSSSMILGARVMALKGKELVD